MDFAHTHPGGAEVPISMLFVDVRGSSQLAHQLGAVEFGKLMNRFYKAATEVLVQTDAFIDKFVGDEVIGLYLPVFTGDKHASLAVEAARRLLGATGQSTASDDRTPVGIGVHTGPAYVGTVSGTEHSISDITALGENVNIAARLASTAGAGEALISDAAWTAAQMNPDDNGDRREVELRGIPGSIGVRALRS
jgi:adenylate cyclase